MDVPAVPVPVAMRMAVAMPMSVTVPMAMSPDPSRPVGVPETDIQVPDAGEPAPMPAVRPEADVPARMKPDVGGRGMGVRAMRRPMRVGGDRHRRKGQQDGRKDPGVAK